MKKGERYNIRNYRPDGVEIFEGIAKLIKPLEVDSDYWLVEFEEDGPGEQFARHVQPEDRIDAAIAKGVPHE